MEAADLQAAVVLAINRLLPNGPTVAAADIDVVMQPSAATGQVHAVVSLLSGRAKDKRAVTCVAREVLETTPDRLLRALETTNAVFAGASNSTTVTSSIHCQRCAFDRCSSSASYSSPGFVTKTLHAFDPTCSITPGTTFMEYARPLNECIDCACVGLIRRLDMEESGCAVGNTIYAGFYGDVAECSADPALWLPLESGSNDSAPATVVVGNCFEESTGLYAKFHCDTHEQVICENPAASSVTKATAVIIEFYTDTLCKDATPQDDRLFMFADDATCFPIASNLSPTGFVYLKANFGGATCDESASVGVTVHTDQLCSSDPIPGVSGPVPLDFCIVGSPLAGGLNMVASCAC
jgi:hypothetical protein